MVVKSSSVSVRDEALDRLAVKVNVNVNAHTTCRSRYYHASKIRSVSVSLKDRTPIFIARGTVCRQISSSLLTPAVGVWRNASYHSTTKDSKSMSYLSIAYGGYTVYPHHPYTQMRASRITMVASMPQCRSLVQVILARSSVAFQLSSTGQEPSM